jgi:hypothetical protein
MTSLLKTGGITDLRMRLGRPFAGDKHDQGDLSIPPFPLHMVEKTGFIVTFGAGNKVVGRGLPGVYVYLHVMAETTEGGSFGESVHGPSQNEQEEQANTKEESDPLLMFLRPPIGLLPKGDPEVRDILKQIGQSPQPTSN